MAERIESETLSDNLRDYTQRSMYTALPGKVHTYDASKQTAEVQVQTDTEAPILPSVPVIWPRGGNGYLHFPLQAGDFGLIVCCKDDIGAWRQRGEPGDSGDIGQHGLQNAVFIPGLVPANNELATASGATILSGSDVRLGDSGASEKVMCGDEFESDLGDFIDALDIWATAVATAVNDGTLDTATIAFEVATSVFKNSIKLSPSVKVEAP